MIAFSIGWIHIYWYGIFYLIGFLSAYIFLKKLGKTKLFDTLPKLKNLLANNTEDILITAVLGVLIGWRLGHVIIYDFQYFLKHPGQIFAIRSWGMSFIGGMLGVTWAFLIFKKIKTLSWKEFFLLMDSVLVMVPLGIMLGRIGNFLNQELYGLLVQENFRWLSEKIVTLLKTTHIVHIYPTAWPERRINTNFLASFFEWAITLIILGIMQWKRNKNKLLDAGKFASVFVIRYSFVRFRLEYLRQESQAEFIWPFTKSQWFFIVFTILGLAFLIKIKTKKKYKTKK